MTKKNFLFSLFLLLLVVFPEVSFAQATGGREFLQRLVIEPHFRKTINFGLILLAGYQWFMYFNGFDPGKAFKDALIPATSTFFAFNWMVVLEWLKLI